MKKKWKISLSVITSILIVAAYIASNPLRRSEDTIRSKLLEELPLGTQLSTVHQYIIKKEWEISYVSEDSGFYDQRTRPASVVGEKAIRASIGDYQDLPFVANVTVFWGFDKDSRLIDVWIWKTWDGI